MSKEFKLRIQYFTVNYFRAVTQPSFIQKYYKCDTYKDLLARTF
jgi:hypothetical protein